VSIVLRKRLLFALLTAVAAVYGWASGAQAHVSDRVSAMDAQLSAVAADVGPHNVVHSASEAGQFRVERAPAPVNPIPAAPDMNDVSAEDAPDDEELADMAANPLGHVHGALQTGPASIQLEPSHAPSTQLDRPPRF